MPEDDGPIDAVRHDERLRRSRRRSLWLLLLLAAGAGLIGTGVTYMVACRFGWSFQYGNGLTLAWNVEREGPGRFRFAKPPLDAPARASHAIPSAEVRLRFDSTLEVPGWISRTAAQKRWPHPSSNAGTLSRSSVRISYIADPLGLDWISASGDISLDPSELPALNALIDERLSTLNQTGPPSIAEMLPSPETYTPHLGDWTNRGTCPVDARLLALGGTAPAGLMLLAGLAVVWLLANRRARRLRRGCCAWCGHPLADRLCTECGTVFGGGSA